MSQRASLMMMQHHSIGPSLDRSIQMRWYMICYSILVIALLSFHTMVYAQVASFECGKAKTPVEMTICRVPSLGVKDVKMNTYYQILQTIKPGVSGMAYREFRDNIKEDQTNWMEHKRNICQSDVNCLEKAYDQRIADLTDTLMKNVALTYGRMCDEA